MLKGVKLVTAGALCGTMVACAAVDPATMDDFDLHSWDLDAVRAMVPQGPAFIQGLRAGYLAETEQEYADYDFSDFDHFARKTVTSAKGLKVMPDMVSLRELTPEQVDELTAARARLMAGLDGEGRRKAPLAMARAQVAFDCWLEQEEENDVNDIARCKSEFENAMAGVEEALASDIDNVYIVFFAWDRSVITPVSQTILENAANDFANGEASRIILAGHADTSGTEAYNDGLSERRARTVAAALQALGVDAGSIDVEWYGENDLRVETPDDTREPQNRRVEIRFAE